MSLAPQEIHTFSITAAGCLTQAFFACVGLFVGGKKTPTQAAKDGQLEWAT